MNRQSNPTRKNAIMIPRIQIGPAWDAALSADRPVILEAYTDPDVPQLPPHITLKEAEAYAKALLKGDSEGMHLMKQTLESLAESFLPRR
jgi:pyruvate dehydrogenase (quinone)